MQAIQGYYDAGVFQLNEKAPVKRGKFIMFFLEDETPVQPLMTKEEAWRIFRQYSGSIEMDIDEEQERDEYLYEKYGPY